MCQRVSVEECLFYKLSVHERLDFSLSVCTCDPEERTDILCDFVCAVCVHSPCQDVWEGLSAGGYLGDESWGKALGGVQGSKWVKALS